MANILTLNSPTPATVPADGWNVGYKILGSGGPYTLAGPFMSMPININTADPVGTLYEGYITRDCGTLESVQFFWQTPCDCTNAGPGYVESPSGLECQLVETEEPDVTNSGYCLAPSPQEPNYSISGSRIYNLPVTAADIINNIGTVAPYVNADITTAPYWRQNPSGLGNGPMNRNAVWIDSDCNGNKDPLSMGVETTVAYLYNNVGPARQIYVGVAGDNHFHLVVNGVTIMDTSTNVSTANHFNIFHIFPVNIVVGANYFNIIGIGDGSTNDAIAMVIYDNSAAELISANSDLDLNILFATQSLFGTSFDVATCPATYSLDTSGGAGNYICIKTTYADCNQAS